MHASIYSLYIKPVRLNVAAELLKKTRKTFTLEKKKLIFVSFSFFFHFYDLFTFKMYTIRPPFNFRYIKMEFERVKWYILVNRVIARVNLKPACFTRSLCLRCRRRRSSCVSDFVGQTFVLLLSLMF